MWHVWTFIMQWANCLDRQGWLTVLSIGMVLGFLCMRGFGSRY